jgi:hypothetical protein
LDGTLTFILALDTASVLASTALPARFFTAAEADGTGGLPLPLRLVFFTSCVFFFTDDTCYY